MFAYTKTNTPLFNTKELSTLFQKPLPFDSQHLIRALETILLPSSPLTIQKEHETVLEVTSSEYASSSPLYVDKRFIIQTSSLEEKKRPMPSKKTLLKRFSSYPKRPYIWGGNTKDGIPELFEYYPPQTLLTHYEWLHWHFRGVDCSGLLYDITEGATPRNTKDLCHFGYQVETLKPLDMIVWPGHVLFYLTQETLIESRAGVGVTISKASLRLKELERFPYQYRRWI